MDEGLTPEVEGTRVIDADGNEVGIVRAVDNGVAYVDPDPSLSAALRAKLGWGDADRHSYPVDGRDIETVTAHEVRLQRTPDFSSD